MPKIRKRTRWVLLIGALLLLAWGWKAVKDRHAAPQSYLTATVVRGNIEDAVLATGVLQPWRQVDVGSQASGQLKSLKPKLGDTVKKGQLLAEIDPALTENALRDARAGLDVLVAQKRAKQALLKKAELNWRRQHTMVQQDAASRQDVEAADADLASQRADLAALDAQIQQQRIRVDTAQTNLGYTRIAAPIDGTVVSITTQEGQTVVASYQVPTILKIADLSRMTVKAQVSEADVIRIHPGMPVYFVILGAPDKRYYGTLRAIQPSPEKINNAIFFNALFDVPNTDGVLRPDMTAQVSIVLGRADNALLVPSTALGTRAKDGRYAVRVLDAHGKTQVRQVRIGLDNHIKAQVLDGLQAGEKVITGEAPASDTPGAAS